MGTDSDVSATRDGNVPSIDAVYPRGPRAVPADFTAPTLRYRAEVVLVTVGLLTFVAIYLGLIGVCLYAAWSLWSLPLEGRGSIYLLVAGTAILGAIVLFLVKGLFRTQRQDPSRLIEIKRDDEPLLFAFLDRLIADTGAPQPGKVFLSSEVNAAVFYDTSFLSLFWPVRKNLLLGLGLVNHLNVSELKAVLAHELGHFSQSSMKLGSYVYVSNQILDDVIWGRDAFDEMLERLQRTDPRIAIVAWVIGGVVWVLRKLLALLFRLINVLHRSLTRQMEFAADRVAVSVAGSRSMARGLYMAEFADACFAQTMVDLTHAGDHGLYTTDLFHHQSRAIDEVRRQARKPRWGSVDDDDVALFALDAQTKPSMWATHPPSAEREAAARSANVDCDIDERSAWTLFRDPARWRTELTTQVVYAGMGGRALKRLPVDAAEVQRFIDAEREETVAAARYAEMYEGRPLARLDVEGVIERVGRAPRPDAEVVTALAALHERIQALSTRTRALQDDARTAVLALRGAHQGASFQALDKEWSHREAEAVLGQIDAAQKAIDREFEAVDLEWLEVHASMAIRASDGSIDRLAELYDFLLAVDALLARVVAARQAATPSLEALFSGKRVEGPAIEQALFALRALHENVSHVLASAADVRVPALKNLEGVATLGPFLLEAPLVSDAGLRAGQINGQDVGALLGSTTEMIDKLTRMKRKCLGAVIALQDELVARVQRRPSFAAPPLATTTPPSDEAG